MGALLVTMLLSAGNKIFLCSGQSLMGGSATVTPLSTTQSCGNRMVSGILYNSNPSGITAAPSLSAFPFADLVEGDSAESPRSGIANKYCELTGNSVDVVTGAKGGTAYTGIKKGTEPYAELERQLESFSARSGSRCEAFILMHGEQDHANGTSRATYAANIEEFRNDLDTKCRKLGYSGGPLPAYVQQFSSWTDDNFSGTNTTSLIPLAAYDAARSSNGKIKITGANYPWTHAADGVHLTNTSSRSVGETIGRAIATGSSWQPLWPVNYTPMPPVSISSNVITVYFYTPTPPLVIDTTTVTGVSSTTRGFEYTCGSSPPTITAVDCSASCSSSICSCQITLSGAPSAPCQADDKVGYALTGTDNNAGGPGSGPRGNLRDSASSPNWMIHWQEDVP